MMYKLIGPKVDIGIFLDMDIRIEILSHFWFTRGEDCLFLRAQQAAILKRKYHGIGQLMNYE